MYVLNETRARIERWISLPGSADRSSDHTLYEQAGIQGLGFGI